MRKPELWKKKSFQWVAKAEQFKAIVHHVFLQLAYLGDEETIKLYQNKLRKYKLYKNFRINVSYIKRKAYREVNSGKYESALSKIAEEFHKGSYTALPWMEMVIEQLYELEELEKLVA